VTSNSKQLSILANPLQKIQEATEASSAALNFISEVVLRMNTTAIDTVNELKKQTGILTDIRSILRDQNKSLAKGTAAKGGPAGRGFTPMSAKDTGLTALMILGIAGAIVGAAALFSLVPSVTIPQLLTVLAIAGIFALIAPTFVKIAEVLGKNSRDIVGEGKNSADMSNPKSMFALAGSTVLVMAAMALSMVIAGAIFTMMPTNISGMQLLMALAVAIVLIPTAYAYSLILTATKDIKKEQLIFAALAIPLMAIGIVLAGVAFMFMPTNISGMQLLMALAVAIVLIPAAFAYSLVLEATKDIKKEQLIFAALAIPLIALSILAAALIFQGLGAISKFIAPDPLWVLKAGFALIIFAVPFYIVSKAIKGLGFKELLFMAVALPIVAFGVLAAAWIFQGLEGIKYFSPDLMWVIKAGLSMVVFGVILYLSSKVVGKMTAMEMTKSLVGVVITAFAIVAVAWILSYAPTTWISPPLDWTINIAAALGVMGVAIVAMGVASEAVGGPVTLLLGGLGIIIAAITILAVGWILAGLAPVMPQLVQVAQGFTAILLAPINGMIDVFSRFKNEIGIENMIGLATGIAALGGAWLIFVAAMAGSSIAGGIGNVIGGILDGIGSLFGGDNPSPI